MYRAIVLSIFLAALIGAVAGGIMSYTILGERVKNEVESQLAVFQKKPDLTENNSNDSADHKGSPESRDSNSNFNLHSEEKIFTEVYKKVSPSVVHVSTVQYYRNFFFQIVPQEGTGSGFIISKDGLILTNNHVIFGAQELTVRLINGKEYSATLVGADDMTDLAVLRVENVEIKPEWVAELGNSDKLQVGQRAIAIGNPFGFDSTITVGVISALNRPLTVDQITYENMIQTDASINPGNSGGPLINSSGEVIGINTVIYSRSGGSQGVGFAIPINIAKKISDDLIKYGRVRRPSLGFQGLTLLPNLARALGLSVDHGVLVQKVEPGSAAAEAGLQGGRNIVILRDAFRQYSFYNDGDVIVELNGKRVDEISRLADQIRRMEIGTTVTLKVIRGGREVLLTMVLKE